MNKTNLPLTLGLLISVLILFVAVFPGAVTRQGPYVMQDLRSWMEDGSLQFKAAPFPPSEQNQMGTDELGRDIWSRIAYGTQLTLTLGLLIVVGRFVIALPIALAAGFGSPAAKSALRLAGLVFSAIPALLFAVIILQQQYFVSLDKSGSMFAFILVLSGVGWAKMGLLLADKTEEVLRQPFILSERAIGKGGMRIAWENVLPHLAPEAVILFFMELARALSMVMQLGIFSVFVGNLRVVGSTDGGLIRYLDISYEPEWAGMLASARSRLSTSPWMVIWPALAFFICVFAFNLIGEGLRRRFQDDLVSSTRNFKSGKKHVSIYLVAMVLFVVPAVIVVHQTRNIPPLMIEPSRIPAPSILGTPGEDLNLELLTDRMVENGLIPTSESGFTVSYPIIGARYVSSSSMTIDADGELYSADEGVDYRITQFNDDFSGIPLVDTGNLDLFSPPEGDGLRDRIALVEGTLYSDEGLKWILGRRVSQSGMIGALVVKPDFGSRRMNRIISSDGNGAVIEISPNLADRLKTNGNISLSMKAEILKMAGEGRNVLGILPGTDPLLGEEIIMIAIGREEADAGSALMNRIAAEGGNRRSYAFLFLDGTVSDTFHGIRAFEHHLPFGAADVVLFLDLSSLNSGAAGEVLTVNMEQAPMTRYYAWSIGYSLEGMMDTAGISVDKEPMEDKNGAFVYRDLESANIMFWNHGIPSIRIAGSLNPELMGMIAEALERNDI